MISVKKLIAMLSEMDPEAGVLVCSDSDGNGYAPVDELISATYDEGSASMGDIEIGVTEDYVGCFGYTKEDVRDTPCVVIYPE